MVEALSGEKTPRIIGVGFMNVFERAACAGWDEKLNFNMMIGSKGEQC